MHCLLTVMTGEGSFVYSARESRGEELEQLPNHKEGWGEGGGEGEELDNGH